MILSCCGSIFNTSGETFFYIERYKTTPNNRIFSDKNTADEIIYIATCPNCGHFVIKYRQRIKNKAGKKKLGKTIDFKGIKADEFFCENYSKLIEYPLESPFLNVKNSKTIPFVYGKVINEHTQQPFYIDESGKAGEEIKTKVSIENLHG